MKNIFLLLGGLGAYFVISNANRRKEIVSKLQEMIPEIVSINKVGIGNNISQVIINPQLKIYNPFPLNIPLKVKTLELLKNGKTIASGSPKTDATTIIQATGNTFINDITFTLSITKAVSQILKGDTLHIRINAAVQGIPVKYTVPVSQKEILKAGLL